MPEKYGPRWRVNALEKAVAEDAAAGAQRRARRVRKSEDQKTWEILVQFWRGQSYNRWGQISNGHRNKHSPEYASYTEGLQRLAERGLVVFNEDSRHWEWTKAGAEWCNEFIARHKEEEK